MWQVEKKSIARSASILHIDVEATANERFSTAVSCVLAPRGDIKSGTAWLADAMSYVSKSTSPHSVFRERADYLVAAFEEAIKVKGVVMSEMRPILQVANTIIRCIRKKDAPVAKTDDDILEDNDAEADQYLAANIPPLAELVMMEARLLDLLLEEELSTALNKGSKQVSLKHLIMLDWIAVSLGKGVKPSDSLIAVAKSLAGTSECRDLHAPPLSAFESDGGAGVPGVGPYKAPEREKCPFCESPVGMTDPYKLTCPLGHSLERCLYSLRVVSTPIVKRCLICERCTMTDPGANCIPCPYDVGALRAS